MAQSSNTKKTTKTTSKPAVKTVAKTSTKPAAKTVAKPTAKPTASKTQGTTSPTKSGRTPKSWNIALLWLLNIALIGSLAYGATKYDELSHQIQDLRQQDHQSSQIETVQPIYVFNLEKVVAASDLVAIQKDFEEQIFKLGDEVEKAKKKIAGLKKSKVNEDFSDVYLKSLVMKRDELILNHEKEMAEISENINKALAEVAEEKNAPAIFNFRSIAATTKHVIDVSDEVITKISNLLKKSK